VWLEAGRAADRSEIVAALGVTPAAAVRQARMKGRLTAARVVVRRSRLSRRAGAGWGGRRTAPPEGTGASPCGESGFIRHVVTVRSAAPPYEGLNSGRRLLAGLDLVAIAGRSLLAVAQLAGHPRGTGPVTWAGRTMAGPGPMAGPVQRAGPVSTRLARAKGGVAAARWPTCAGRRPGPATPAPAKAPGASVRSKLVAAHWPPAAAVAAGFADRETCTRAPSRGSARFAPRRWAAGWPPPRTRSGRPPRVQAPPAANARKGLTPGLSPGGAGGQPRPRRVRRLVVLHLVIRSSGHYPARPGAVSDNDWGRAASQRRTLRAGPHEVATCSASTKPDLRASPT